MSDAYDCLDGMVGAALVREAAPNPRRIRDLITRVRGTAICPEISDEDAELMARRFEERLGVTMTIGSVLTDREYEPWLNAALSEIDPYYWNRYRKLLAEHRFSKGVISTVDRVTDRILGLLEDPAKEGPWDRRGMVVGHVQSGKTANYTGVICKAADAGYKLIVVIAGIHNNLRNQTQLRIDEGFVGRDSARLLSQRGDRFVGVGRYDQTRRPVTFTNSVKDFNKAMATGVGIPLQNLNEPAVFVIKKNTNTLRNLLEWLAEHNARRGTRTVDAPMLLIDDEADNASINIRHSKQEVSTINGQIRDLLNMFQRSCYVGYTATPFANIFIDPKTDDDMRGEDLFPRNFIISLDPPSNYFGATRVLLDQPESVIRHIEDTADLLPAKHKIDHRVVALPPSLLKAVRTFVVARAIRLARGHEGMHCSMLINASRFTNVQSQIRNEVHEVVEQIQSSVRVHGARPLYDSLKDPEIAALHDVWLQEYSDAGFDWSVIQGHLNDAAAPISVVEVNSRAAGTLNYRDHGKHGLNVIAIGGYSLSRGLTLEGLMVSYFLRNSMMYDTLMQMGRWFGYRPEYDDLCRVWMTEEAEGWYAHVAESIEMLRDELRSMEAAGATPEEFGLKVRAHPDTLIVTARNKMGSGEPVVMEVGLANEFVETHILHRDAGSLEANRLAAVLLARAVQEDRNPFDSVIDVTGGRLFNNVAVVPVLDFISDFQNHPGSMLTEGDPVRRYISDRKEELAKWDVLFTSIGRASGQPYESLGWPINCQRRTAGVRSNQTTLHIGNKQRVASRGIEATGLTDDQVRRAEEKYRDQRETEGNLPPGGKLNYPDRIYRNVRDRPLLIVHLLRVEIVGAEALEPVVAWSLSFPKTDTDEQRVEYVVNTTWLNEHYAGERDEDEMEGDDV